MTSDRFTPYAVTALRIIGALLFIEHGLMKLVAFPAMQPGLPHPVPPLMLVAGVIEVAGGVLIAVGLFTRIVAFVAAGEMAVAYFLAHASQGFWPALNHGDAAILFCFIFLYFAAAGAGPWSADASRAAARAR